MIPTSSTHTSHDALLVGLAMVRQNWDRSRASYLDNFRAFAIDCLSGCEAGISDSDLQTRIAERFGITIPLGPLKTLVGRLVTDQFVVRRQGLIYPGDKLADHEPLVGQRESAARRVSALTRSLVAYAEETLGLQWTDQQAEAALQAYVEDWKGSLELLGSEYRSGPQQPRLVNDTETHFAVSSFALALRDGHPHEFEYLLDVIRGSMITTGLYLNPGTKSQGFAGQTWAYLDAPLILDLVLGDEDEMAAVRELLEHCLLLEMPVAGFDHSVAEARGVIEATARGLRDARSDRPSRLPAQGLHLRHSASVLEQTADNLPALLEARGVEIVRKPVWSGASVTDEPALASTIQEAVGYLRAATRDIDVKSLVAIQEIRRGEMPPSLERAKAVFVTSNRKLARGAARHFGTAGDPNAVPVAMTDIELTTLLWLKAPTSPPDLPWRTVIADSRSAVQPSDALWSRFLDEVDRLREADEIDADSYFIARCSIESRRELMERTHGIVGRATPETVAEAVREATAALTQPVVEAAVRERDAALDKAQRIIVERDLREGELLVAAADRGRDEYADLVAKRLASGVAGVLTLSCFCGFMLISLMNLFDLQGAWRLVVQAGLFLAGGWLAWLTLTGGSARDWFSRLMVGPIRAILPDPLERDTT